MQNTGADPMSAANQRNVLLIDLHRPREIAEVCQQIAASKTNSIEVIGCSFKELSDVDKLLDAINQHPTIKRIFIRISADNALEISNKIFEALKDNKKISSLRMEGASMQSPAQEFCDMLKSNKTLREIKLVATDILEDGKNHVAAAIEQIVLSGKANKGLTDFFMLGVQINGAIPEDDDDTFNETMGPLKGLSAEISKRKYSSAMHGKTPDTTLADPSTTTERPAVSMKQEKKIIK